MALVEKEEFLKFLSKVYSEGFEAGMRCGIQQYSEVLNSFTENVKKIELEPAKEKARTLFEQTMGPALSDVIVKKSNIIDFESAKK